jgi:hypothetical protein
VSAGLSTTLNSANDPEKGRATCVIELLDRNKFEILFHIFLPVVRLTVKPKFRTVKRWGRNFLCGLYAEIHYAGMLNHGHHVQKAHESDLL